MKDYENFKPVPITGASGSELILENGTLVIDAISSWWCKSLGHGHPRLKAAAKRQIDNFEHVILANTTNTTIVELSEKLATLCPALDKVFYGGDGSTAVEIAVKMSLQARKIKGETKNRFMALRNGYHGETVMTLALGDLGIYKQDYLDLMPAVSFIENIPYVASKEDPLWQDCSAAWGKIEAQLNEQKDELSAIVFEPILQGAGAMMLYSADFLRRLRRWANSNNVHLIADEILTGFGRTGKMMACEHAGITPDFLCLSKGLTSGFLAMSAMLTSTEIYELFYDDYEKQKSFLHSNTYAGNALAAAVANEAFDIYKELDIAAVATRLESAMRERMAKVAEKTGRLKNIRAIGGMIAADLDLPRHLENKRIGFELYQIALKNGALLRPLGNSVYWLPPLNIEHNTLDRLADITERSIMELKL
jgi:adenosylmethionine-8-amino-7-oxononanoate aminotransferase